MEVDEKEISVLLTAALAQGVAEDAWGVVGSSARGKADRGKMRMNRAGFLVLAADPWREGGMNGEKELDMDQVHEDLMLLTCQKVSLEKIMASRAEDADLDLPRVFLATWKYDRHSVDLKFLENSRLRPVHPH